MNYIKNIYADEKNQLYVRTQIETHLRDTFNINIENIPNINTQIQEYMYKAYSNFKKEQNPNPAIADAQIQSKDSYTIIENMNKEAIELFVKYYVNDYKSKQNIFSNSETSDNYCSFTQNSFNQASTFLTDQQTSQQQHINKIMMRSTNRDAYFDDRNSTVSNIYTDQGFNPRELHKNIVKNYEENKKRANTYRFKQ
jgi:hypothetical protein